MKKNRNKKKHSGSSVFLNILIVICLAMISVCGYQIINFYLHEKHSDNIRESLKKDPEPSGPPQNTRWVPYKTMHDLNSDYVGWILWDSDLISEPMVQGRTNDDYLRRDFDGKYDVWGTVFIDANEKLPAVNTMIYGHSLAGSKTDRTKFSQLQNMTDQNFYEQNSTFKIYWKDKIDSYKIISASVVDSASDNWNYQSGEFFDDKDKQDWINAAVNHSEITSHITPTVADKFVTLQTCVDTATALRYVVVAVQTGESDYPE